MGTSNSFSGPNPATPLVPTWLEPTPSPMPATPAIPPAGDSQDADTPATPNSAMPGLPPIQPSPAINRFAVARNNFSRFAASGGNDGASLRRAVSHYISISSGGTRQAALRMGASRAASGRLLNFLTDVRERGARDALRTLNFDRLAGWPIEDVFLGLADYVCPEVATLDDGIARDSFIETIADLAENGITDLDSLTADQMQTVMELYATHAIEARLCNDIGTKAIILPLDIKSAGEVQAQLRDFIRRGVSDVLTAARDALNEMTQGSIIGFINGIYENAFSILQQLAEMEPV